ncbi:MAG TPA: DsrE family protein [Pelobium sp.]
MRKLIPLIITLLVLGACSKKLKPSALEVKNQNYTGAVAAREKYYAVYQLDTNDSGVLDKAFRNINNALADPRLINKLKVEVVAFSAGTKVMLKGSIYEPQLKDLLQKGVILVQCNNSLIEQGLNRNQVLPFIGIVPSGNGELVIRNAEGWAIIKP